jgi:leader peptidase (prepilin peptidase)/N-methyltransferase
MSRPVFSVGLAGRSTRRILCARIALALVAAACVLTSLAVAPGALGITGAGLALIMLAIALADARHMLIPDELSATALALALVRAGLENAHEALASVAMATSRGLILALAFLALRAVYRRLRGREGIGLGDVKLAGVAGAWLDWTTVPLVIEIAALAAISTYVTRQFLLARPIHAASRMPFGLFLAPAIWLGWLIEAYARASI